MIWLRSLTDTALHPMTSTLWKCLLTLQMADPESIYLNLMVSSADYIAWLQLARWKLFRFIRQILCHNTRKHSSESEAFPACEAYCQLGLIAIIWFGRFTASVQRLWKWSLKTYCYCQQTLKQTRKSSAGSLYCSTLYIKLFIWESFYTQSFLHCCLSRGIWVRKS